MNAPDPVARFFAAINAKDIDALAAVIHPDFEMIVPQKPARGFRGKAQEVANIRLLCESHPDLVLTVLRRVDDGDEVWTETHLVGERIEMAAVTIFTVDRATGTLAGGRYFSDPVDRTAPSIDLFMDSLAKGN